MSAKSADRARTVTNGGVTQDVSQPEVIAADVTEVLSAVSSKDDRRARNISTVKSASPYRCR